jgi:hypothetical protein
MGGEQRLLLALEMSLFTRELAKQGFREQHPEWSDTDVTCELMRRAVPADQLPAFLR